MKVIDKFPNTKDAIDAYNNLVSKTMPFDKWLECEFIDQLKEPPKPTLLDAAIGVIAAWEKWYENFSQLENKIYDLCSAIELEKMKPVRNCDKYKTVEESKMAFMEMCNKTKCRECKFKDVRPINCYSEWLRAEVQ